MINDKTRIENREATAMREPINKSLIICSFLLFSTSAVGQTRQSVLYAFGTNAGTNDGSSPNGGLVFDDAGNIYGTTAFGGGNVTAACPSGCGTVFELSPLPGGGWSETVLHSFADNQDGMLPQSGVVLDGQGNLYGTTSGDGAGNCQSPYCGTVFELSPVGDGTWRETILYAFTGLSDGAFPYATPLIFDAAGNLYGATSEGENGYGTVFELSPPSFPDSEWTKTTLYDFCQNGGNCTDGASPQGGLVFDGSGNLYGTTAQGGFQGIGGMVYKLTPGFGGVWTETVLDRFKPTSGGMPQGGVSLDASGNLYGTLYTGGLTGPHCESRYPPNTCGGVFRLSLRIGGGGMVFLFSGTDGGNPVAGVVLDGSTVYGSTLRGGLGNGFGTVFMITAKKERVLHKFCSLPNCADGAGPIGKITLNGGIIYGTAAGGGTYSQGVVFAIAPQ